MSEQDTGIASYLNSFEHTGVYIIDRKTMEVYFENTTAQKYTGKDRIGQPCFLVHGNKSMCASCPLRVKERKTFVNRADVRMIFSVSAKDSIWQGKEAYTIVVEKERDISEKKSLSEESIDRMNRALHSSIISYVDVNMVTEMCQAIHFAEDGDHRIFDIPYEQYMQEVCMRLCVNEHDRLRGNKVLGMEHLRELSADSDGATEESVRFRIEAEEGREQVLESTAYILRDELPHHVSIVTKEVTEEEKNRIQLSLYNKMASSSVTTFQLNLTGNTFQNVAGVSLYTTNVMDKINTCRSLDDFYRLIVQYTIGEEEQKKAGEFFDREKQLRLFADHKSIIRQRLPIDMDNGSFMWMDITCSMLQNPFSGDIEAILSSEKVDENVIGENMINQMISNDYDYLALFDLVNHTNQVFTNSTRYQKEQLENNLGQEKREAYLRSMYVGDDIETFLYHNSISYIRKRLEKEEQFDNYYYVREKDGTTSYKRETFSYLNGDTRYLLLSRTDNSNAVRSQEEVNQKLTEALELAKRATEERTELFARMSHDMRTPMNGILGMTALSRDETDVEVLQSNMKKIDSSGKYMLRLINDTLDMKRIETGRLILKPRITRCSSFIENLEEMILPNVREAELDFRVINKNIDLERYTMVDPVRLKQILTNLLNNAIKFTPKGGMVVLSMECLKHEDGKDFDLFEVRDTGIGMSREFIKNQAFLPYAQENNNLTGKYAGPGLGLAITKSLLELMGGRIEVESELGEGSVFRVYLEFPMVPEEEAKRMLQKENRALREIREKLDHKKVLLCEDHPLNAEISRKLLERVGCEVVWAEDGAQGLAMYENSGPYEFDAVLMDIRMPKMDGLEAARAIRVLPRADAKTVPIIAMTANAFEEDREASRNAGMNEHLSKPVVPGMLYGTLVRFVQ